MIYVERFTFNQHRCLASTLDTMYDPESAVLCCTVLCWTQIPQRLRCLNGFDLTVAKFEYLRHTSP